MKRTSRFHKITSFLAICAGITCACICVLLIAGEYHSAHSKFNVDSREAEGWEACRQANPSYYKASEKAVNSSLENLAESQDNFWVKVPKSKMAGYLALGGLCSAALGYLTTWTVVLLGRAVIHGFLKYRAFRRLQSCPN